MTGNEQPGYTIVERLVDATLASHPDRVIRTSRRQGEAIMDEGKAQYYDAAARWLARARSACRLARREDEWRTCHADLLARHGRKRQGGAAGCTAVARSRGNWPVQTMADA